MPKVLIVDDSIFMRNHLDKVLTESGYETIQAGDGQQALRLYGSAHPDVVFMDITMPVMDGLEALIEIRQIDPNAKVIVLTALDQKAVAAQAVRMGAVDFLVKPAPPAKLLLALQYALRSSE